jgi:hypothetical protein
MRGKARFKKIGIIEERTREPNHCTAEASFFLSYPTDNTLYVYKLLFLSFKYLNKYFKLKSAVFSYFGTFSSEIL